VDWKQALQLRPKPRCTLLLAAAAAARSPAVYPSQSTRSVGGFSRCVRPHAVPLAVQRYDTVIAIDNSALARLFAAVVLLLLLLAAEGRER
jgi:hypothetical protein